MLMPLPKELPTSKSKALSILTQVENIVQGQTVLSAGSGKEVILGPRETKIAFWE